MDIIKEYCTGCGLCKALLNKDIVEDKKGFYVVSDINKSDTHILKNICPCYGYASDLYNKNIIWGESKKVYLGYSSDSEIRFHASSGGILTSLCLFLLDKKMVDGIIQVKYDEEDPTKTVTVCSTNREEVLKCCGSRYSMSSPLSNIDTFLNTDKTYAFVGKPCDVVALKNYSNLNPDVTKRIKYYLSFFCAGTPSSNAQKNLLSALEVKGDCKTLTYRGDGWPGLTKVVDRHGEIYSMDYNSSWGKILGRDLRKACKFCLDGIGELADIACGDAWYMSNNSPDFSEHEGRNVIFSRTESGDRLLDLAYKSGYIHIEEFSDYSEYLSVIQKSQFMRRANMRSMLLACKVCFVKTPKYNKKLLKSYSKNVRYKLRLRRFIGTIKRVITNKL